MMVNNNGATHYAVLNAGQSVFFSPSQSPHRFHIIIDHKIKIFDWIRHMTFQILQETLITASPTSSPSPPPQHKH